MLFLSICIWSCASYEPKYREAFDSSNRTSIPTNEVEKTIYLIGDAGYAKEGTSTPGLLALEKHLDAQGKKDDYTIFLGDNIYPDGMPKKDAPDRKISEHRLDVQIEAVKNFEGQTIIIPGNHDWYNEGLKGLEREEKYVEHLIQDKKVFRPSKGCALESIELTENIQLIILDSQWFLADWDKHPTINDNCSEIKTRKALFLEIEGEFKKNQNKTILFALHHPLYTNGVHGGKFAPVKHLFPSQKKIPLPITGTLVNLVRTTGGISPQDNMNEQYRKLRNRLETLAKEGDRIIFASGHEHSLQYIEHDGLRQIVSGSGAKNSYATLGADGLFAYPGQGFAQLDIMKDGSSRVTYFGSTNNEPTLLFQTEIYPKVSTFDVSTIAPVTDSIISASIYSDEEIDKTGFYESVWGDHYRELYGTKIQANVAILDTLYGGLEVVRKGGGHQTRSLRLKDKDDREYNLRALRKDGVQFLQSVLFKENYVKESFENTVSEKILQDFYTSAHPYIFKVIPDLSDAVGIFHTNPEILYVPKQKALGKYNTEYGDELYMIEERPEDNFKDLESFGQPDDIESTADLYDKLRRDEKYMLDEDAFIKARLFDMLIGDWDRHEDQWRWAEYKRDDGTSLYKPIPRDRDQAFSNFDGAFLGAIRGLIGFANQFQVYDGKLKDVKWINISATQLDRTLLNNTSKKAWVAQAEFIKENLTDAIIDKAFLNLPKETQGDSMEGIKKNLKERRDNLTDIAIRYQKFLDDLGIVTGTDKDDYIDIERLPEGKTRITISRIKDGKKADVVNERIYDSNVTKEIWVYGLDDDDIFEVRGKGDKPIKIRIIGGQNNDTYNIKKGRKITVYDHKSKKNTVVKKGGARFRFTDDYEINHFNKEQKVFGANSITPLIGFNPDDGISLGLTNTFIFNGFNLNPFTQRHALNLNYFFATSSFSLGYQGEFAGMFGNYNLLLEGHYTNPNFAVNFFGFGNDTENFQDDLDFDYNRVRLSRYGGNIGIVRNGRFGSYFAHKIGIDGIEVERTENRYLALESNIPEDDDIFDRIWFGSIESTYRYETYDVPANPSRGMKFELIAGAKANTTDFERTYGYIKPYLGFYNPLSRNGNFVLRTAAAGEFNIGRQYEFYQSAQAGGHGLLRGYRNQRFSGQSALSGSADLRYGFRQFKTKVLPLQIGVFAGGDVGRVWLDTLPESNTWHTDVGGGFWINSTDAVNGTFNLFGGEDGLRFSFQFLFTF